MKILVVDDSKVIRKIVAECIKKMGHEAVFAENGLDCLQFVAQNRVDLILMDIEMPGMNGLVATRAIRKTLHDDWFPIIFLTTKIDDQSFADGITAGGDAYLPKPLNPLRLQFTIVAMERIYQMRQKMYHAQEELLIANENLEKLSLFDQLTGLANRRNFDRVMENQYLLAKRNKSPLSLIICDVDFFKKYNDNYGHLKGDDCLVKVAQTISRVVSRPGDLACRYGGEEFTIILPNTDLQGARATAEKLRATMTEDKIQHLYSAIADHITLSVGIATYNGQYNSVDAITKAADDALYRAKEKGRNRIEVA